MPLGLVQIQQLPHLGIQPRIDAAQPLGQILVHGAFGDAEACGGGADGGFVLKNIRCQITGALFEFGLQTHHSLYAAGAARCLLHVYEAVRGDMSG